MSAEADIPDRLRTVVRTPRAVVVDVAARAVRVPTVTGHVGLRPRREPLVLAVEPGLVLIRDPDGDPARDPGRLRILYVGTAGGLLRCDGRRATLLTPLAVSGDNEQHVLEMLSAAVAEPSDEMEARATLGRLQSSILRELRENQRQAGQHLGDRG